MKIIEVKENKKQYLGLLLLADEQEDMVDRYLDRRRQRHPRCHHRQHRRGVLRRAGGTAAGVPSTADTRAVGDFASVGKCALQRKNMW